MTSGTNENKKNGFELLGKKWVLWLDKSTVYVLLIGIALSLVLSIFITDVYQTVMLYTFLSSMVLAMVHHFFLYRVIKCPNCGSNMAKYQNGKNIPMKTVYKNLNEIPKCKHCGWSGSVV
jgi:uncharacterized membrane protein